MDPPSLERNGVRRGLGILCLSLATAAAALGGEPPPEVTPAPRVVLVIGAPGEEEYQKAFERSHQTWEEACRLAGAQPSTIGLEPEAGTNDFQRLREVLNSEPREGKTELWLVLIGHGTFDGKEAKFNLRGPDISPADLAAWLEPFQRPLVLIDTSSSSGPFLSKLSRPGRVIVTATRSGHEQNYARFGQFFSGAIGNSKADLDKDGQVSVLEAFLQSAHELGEFYKTEGRLATEHPLIDDTGDAFGTPPDWFRGVRAVKRAADGAALDGLRAHQFHLIWSESERQLSPALRERRNELERAIEELRATKEKVTADEYYRQLEVLLLELARLYDSPESAGPRPPTAVNGPDPQ